MFSELGVFVIREESSFHNRQISEESNHNTEIMAGTHELEANKPSKPRCGFLQASRHDARSSSTSSSSSNNNDEDKDDDNDDNDDNDDEDDDDEDDEASLSRFSCFLFRLWG